MAKKFKFEDTKVSIGKDMTLEIKEVRGTASVTSFKDGFNEVSSDTKTHFHWKLRGLASKLGADEVGSDDFDPTKQELYHVSIKSDAFDIGDTFGGFKTREDAIRNAVEFAKRNGLEIDGYRAGKKRAGEKRASKK